MRNALRFLLSFLILCGFTPAVWAESARPILGQTISAASLVLPQIETIRYATLDPNDGSKLKVITPNNWVPLIGRVAESLTQTRHVFKKLLGTIPAMETAVHLMDQESFFKETGAPRWTIAVYYRNQIMIPLASSMHIDLDNFTRSIRHEYTHAINHALSGGRCPGWLDEGLAEWSEGAANPSRKGALRSWLASQPPVKLSLLQGGFTNLDTETAAAAYTQSLFAAQRMIDLFGFGAIKNFFEKLREGRSQEKAFKAAFQMSESAFENRLGAELRQIDKFPARSVAASLFTSK